MEDVIAGVAVIGVVPIFDAMLRWQRWLEVSGRANANTRRQYRRIVVAFIADVAADPEWSGSRDPFQVTEDDLVTYVAERTTPQGEHRNMLLKALRSFYGWCVERDVTPTNPAAHLRPRKPKMMPAPSLDAAQVDALLAAAETVDPRARWAIQLQLATGCRVASLIAATAADVHEGRSGPSILFRETKFDQPYEAPLGPLGQEAVARLIELADYRPPRASRRPTLVGVGYERYRQWLKAAGQAAGLPVWTHLLRHTTATIYASEGVDVRTMMEMLNWQSPAMLRRYAAASDQNMRAAAL